VSTVDTLRRCCFRSAWLRQHQKSPHLLPHMARGPYTTYGYGGRNAPRGNQSERGIQMAPTQTSQSHIEACSAHANPTWKSAALAATMRLARQRRQFTSADVLRELEMSSDARTHDLRAIGGVLQEARNLGIIESVGLVRRNDRHSRGATTLWQSKVVVRQPEPTVSHSQ